MLVYDIIARRVVMLDSTLRTIGIIVDSAGGAANSHGRQPGGLLAYRGDSTLFVDPGSSSILVLDGAGKVSRVMAIAGGLTGALPGGGPAGTPGIDAQGRLVFRGVPARKRPPPGTPGPIVPGDSAPVVRFDFGSRRIDTIGFVGLLKTRYAVNSPADGGWIAHPVINPLPMVDDWAIMADGSVAIVRGQDYHIDGIAADGTRSSSARLPHEWKRLDDTDKQAIIDSTHASLDRLMADAVRRSPDASKALAGWSALLGTGLISVGMVVGAGTAPAAQMAAYAAPLEFVSVSEVPDYPPPFLPGAAHGDADGNLWIRTNVATAGGVIHDVIDGSGRLVRRTLVPTGRVVTGFGPGGVVYLAVRDGDRARLERARLVP